MWAVAMLRLCTLPVAMFSWCDVILRPATDINQRTYAAVMHRLCTLVISMFTVYYAIPLAYTDIHYVPVLRQCIDQVPHHYSPAMSDVMILTGIGTDIRVLF